jgi:acylphosphatase
LDEKIRYEIRVTGRVQGVGFRWSAVTEAQKHDITGYIKNLYDGSVYIDAEGSVEQLNAFIEWCRKGPGLSFVESVTTVPLPPVNYKDFRVRY